MIKKRNNIMGKISFWLHNSINLCIFIEIFKLFLVFIDSNIFYMGCCKSSSSLKSDKKRYNKNHL